MGKISALFLSGLLTSMVWLGYVGFLGDQATQYSYTDHSGALQDLSMYDAIDSELNTTKLGLEEGTVSSTEADNPWEASLETGRELLDSPSTFNDMIGTIYEMDDITIGYYFVGIMISIISLYFIFTIYMNWSGRPI